MANTFTVTIATDNGDVTDGTLGSPATDGSNDASGTLRQAINYANATGGPVTIDFALPNGQTTITLGAALQPILNAVTINGNGATIQGTSTANGVTTSNRIFFVGVDDATATDSAYAGTDFAGRIAVNLNGLTLTGGTATGGTGSTGGGGGLGAGGALFVNQNADVTLNDVAFTDDAATGGSAGASLGAHEPGGGGGGLGGDGGRQGGGGGLGGDGGYQGAGGGVFGLGGNGADSGGGGYSGNGSGDYIDHDGSLALYGLTAESGGSGGSGGVDGEGSSGGVDGGGGGYGNHFALAGGGGGGFGGGEGGDNDGGDGGFGGGGGDGVGGAIGDGGGGGFGGGGGQGYRNGGGGGFGGGGGGGGANGGGGGFGGGGGSGGANGGGGGFGGGGGSVGAVAGGASGFGATAATASQGGNGAGLGGAVFVAYGGTLEIDGTSQETGGTAIQGGSAAKAGLGFGGGIFFEGSPTNGTGVAASVLTFGAGDQSIDDVIADLDGSGGSGAADGFTQASGTTTTNLVGGVTGVAKTGTGTLKLSNANTYTGGTALDAGTLELASYGASGSGAITFGGTAPATLRLDATVFTFQGQGPSVTADFASPVAAFGPGDAIDLKDLTYSGPVTVDDTGQTLSVTDRDGTNLLTDFHAAPGVNAASFMTKSDGTANGTLVYIPGPATHFSVVLPATGTADTTNGVTVTALDAEGDVATGYTGTVHFTSSDPKATLPGDMTLTNGTGTFSETPGTAGTETVTATDTTSSTITGTSNAEAVAPGAATHFSVVLPATGTVGAANSVTVTALDAQGNVATGYAGTVHFTSSDPKATLPADMMLANGTGTFSETPFAAGNETVTATDTANGSVTGTSGAEAVAPGAVTHFSVVLPANGAAGTANNVTVTALDAQGNVATGYAGTVHFTSSDPKATLPGNMTLTNGTGTFSETPGTAGTETVTATDTANGSVTGMSNAETVAPGAATHFAVALPATGTAGTTNGVTVTALDADGNTATGYTGTVHFTSSDPKAALPADMVLTGGTGTFSETPGTAGTETVTATDTANGSVTGMSNAETVAPGAATHFAVALPATGTAGVADNVTVTALDANGNTATGYAGTVHFTSSDPKAALPADMVLTNGTGTFSVTPGTAGNETVTATDTANGSVTGTSDAETVAPGAAPSPTVPDAVSISPQVSYEHGVFTLTGTVSSPFGVRSVEISAQVDGVETDLGPAIVTGNTFTFQDAIGLNFQGFFRAKETDGNNVQTASSDPGFSLQGRLPRAKAEQDTYDADGSAVLLATHFSASGQHTVTVEAPGQTIGLQPYEVVFNHHEANTTFVYTPGAERDAIDVIQGFEARGSGHDTASLKGADFGNSIAEVLRNTGNVGGSAFVTDPVTGDAIRLAGVSTADLKRKDFTFHA